MARIDRDEEDRPRRGGVTHAPVPPPPIDAPEDGRDPNERYSYNQNLGAYANRNYQYNVDDEGPGQPGPEPPRDSPEWPRWREAAGAWRRYIGQRQQYVNQMIGAGYNPEDIGIFNRKEEGMAGYKRLMQPGVIDQLRQQSAAYMRTTDAEIDPTTGLYIAGNNYYDSRGMRVDAQGRPIGGIYGEQNTRATFGGNAVPRVAPTNYATPARMPRPAPAPAPTPTPTPIVARPESAANANMRGWGDKPLSPTFRNRPPATRFSPFGI